MMLTGAENGPFSFRLGKVQMRDETDGKDAEKAMAPNDEWSTRWLDELKTWIKDTPASDADAPLTLYPLQLINCRRLELNDAVYIFDEVGCGKTISAGLMALHYLCHRPEKGKRDVLIITEDPIRAQFWNDWLDKLPFIDWGFVSEGWFGSKDPRNFWWAYDYARDFLPPDSRCGNRVHIVSNSKYQIRKANSTKRFGMIIIDEAHVFLNSDRKRYQSLRELAAQNPEKVVFLTATPIKESAGDLNRYQELAKALFGGREPKCGYEGDWKETLRGRGDTPDAEQDSGRGSRKNVLCSRFDPKLPVTRYFKDTAMGLQDSSKHSPRRCLAHMWMYEPEEGFPRFYRGKEEKDKWQRKWSEAKKAALVKGIRDVLESKEPGQKLPNRFVIFTYRIGESYDGSVLDLKRYLVEHLVNEYPDFFLNAEDDVMAVTGDTQHSILAEIRQFSGNRPGALPRILVINQQIGEKGLNLPDYNYVINYQIPDNPAKLEQRFGRIDRLTSIYHEIHMCYLIRSAGCSDPDSSSENFHLALSRYRHGLLCQLPVKNVLLTKEQLEENFRMQKVILERQRVILNILNDSSTLEELFRRCANALMGEPAWRFDPSWPESCKELVLYCWQQQIALKGISPEEKQSFVKVLKRSLTTQRKSYLGEKDYQELKWAGESKEQETLEKLMGDHEKQIDGMGDKIMFSPGGSAFFFLSAVRDKEPEKGCVDYIEDEMKRVAKEDERTAKILSYCRL